MRPSRRSAAGATDESACTPGSVPGCLAASRWAVIHLGLPLPAGSSGPPAGSGGQPSNACAGRRPVAQPPSLSTLLRVGFTEPHRSPGVRWSLTPPFHPYRLCLRRGTAGGLFSVALSRGSPRVAVSDHPALWSPDVPRRRGLPRRRDRPADSSVVPVSLVIAGRTVWSRPPRHTPGTATTPRGRRSGQSAAPHVPGGWSGSTRSATTPGLDGPGGPHRLLLALVLEPELPARLVVGDQHPSDGRLGLDEQRGAPREVTGPTSSCTCSGAEPIGTSCRATTSASVRRSVVATSERRRSHPGSAGPSTKREYPQAGPGHGAHPA